MARAIQTVTELRERAARRASGDMSETEFRSQFSALLSRVPPHTIRESAFFSLPANKPPRILRVWLIALSMFQHGEGQGEYGAIEFLTGDQVVIVN
jgi:hypothetical protein